MADDAELMTLIKAIVADDAAKVSALLADAPALASTRAMLRGATRQTAEQYFFAEIGHYVYAGDTALHIAAAAFRAAMINELLAAGADVQARNRRGAQPLHYAADGNPGSRRWDPEQQREAVRCLLAAGADPNAVDKSGVTPLHRAVRNRCAAVVEALLDGGADPRRPNKNGSTPAQLARWTTGRGGSGSPAAREQQEEIFRLLRRHGVTV
ncbi:ankyrin repeat domain-containing protein [Amycolatopsis sp. GM8]|uniref:ankyrin repeat domain-containing protein n=1 Tax=Amycolatopsis sp. GM8 TaxID=2896530 RepID=UPI001F204C90|nr:ankyrin repeat domain-containing protein [Amycolatopsis sp. GM8]